LIEIRPEVGEYLDHVLLRMLLSFSELSSEAQDTDEVVMVFNGNRYIVGAVEYAGVMGLLSRILSRVIIEKPSGESIVRDVTLTEGGCRYSTVAGDLDEEGEYRIS